MESLDPWPHPEPAALALRLGVAVQAATLFYLAFKHGTSLDALLFMHAGASESLARGWDLGLAVLGLLAALMLAARPWPVAVACASAIFLVQACAVAVVGGRAHAELAPLAHGTRWLAPLALLWLRRTDRTAEVATWILRVAIAATFAAHGWEALRAQPAFLDLLLGAARRWLDRVPSEASAQQVLFAIGLLDVLVALGVLVTRRPRLALWAAVWGLLTLSSRVVVLGPEFVHESLLRCMNAVAPFSLWWLLRSTASRPHP